MNRKVRISEGGSEYIGNLPLGCRLCMRGQKMVLFMGGNCPRPARCSWYCPISDERRGHAQLYADEIRINDPEGAILEARLINARGCSFTGGDPLGNEANIKRTLEYLRGLKEEFPDQFHMHLYTTGIGFSRKLAERLATSGLDEIRFHPAEEDFHRIEYALDLGMQVGAEVPVIPNPDYEKYLTNLIDYVNNVGANFINLNEFEMNGPNSQRLKELGYELDDGTIASVKGSAELAEKILDNLPKHYTVSVHYCPISLKDGPQLRNRYIRRANSLKMAYEEVTEDGTLVFLRVEGKIENLKGLYMELLNESGVPDGMMSLNIDAEPTHLDLPWFLSEEDAFIEALMEYNLEAGIMEALPFRGDYFEVCEYTPIKPK